MNISAAVLGIMAAVVLYGGVALCLVVALKSKRKQGTENESSD